MTPFQNIPASRPILSHLRAAQLAVPLALLALVLPTTACAAPGPQAQQPSNHAVGPGSIPASVAQGGLLRGRLAPGAQVFVLRAAAAGVAASRLPVRVADDGRFVIGVGRDETGPVTLEVVERGVRTPVVIAVAARQWKIERIQGVPQATVNPPPAIAARIAREQAEISLARERDDARTDFDDDYLWPVRGRISGVYGSQRVYNGTPKSAHSGLDVAVPKGTPIHAPAAGVITFANPDLYLTGGTVLLDHGHGVSSNFLHLSRIDVKPGQRVEQGEVIGLVGATGRATGPHMHWGMNWFGTRVDPQLLLPPLKGGVAPATGATP